MATLIVLVLIAVVIGIAWLFVKGIKRAFRVQNELLGVNRTAKCPHCLEAIKPGASVCPHCQREVLTL